MYLSSTIGNIAPALLAAQKTMGDAVKGASNPFFKSRFADLNAVREAVIPAMNAQGITVLQPTVWVEGKSFVRTMLLHTSGEFIASDTEIIAAKLNDPQAHGSGVSYARRYGLQSIANVGAVDDDGEAAMQRKPATSNSSSSSVKESTPTLSPTDVALYGPPPQGASSDSSAPKKSSFKRPGSSSSAAPAAKPSVVTNASSSSEWE